MNRLATHPKYTKNFQKMKLIKKNFAVLSFYDDEQRNLKHCPLMNCPKACLD